MAAPPVREGQSRISASFAACTPSGRTCGKTRPSATRTGTNSSERTSSQTCERRVAGARSRARSSFVVNRRRQSSMIRTSRSRSSAGTRNGDGSGPPSPTLRRFDDGVSVREMGSDPYSTRVQPPFVRSPRPSSSSTRRESTFCCRRVGRVVPPRLAPPPLLVGVSSSRRAPRVDSDRLPHSFLLRLDLRVISASAIFSAWQSASSRSSRATRARCARTLAFSASHRARISASRRCAARAGGLDFGVGVDRSRVGWPRRGWRETGEARRRRTPRARRRARHGGDLLNLELGALQTDRGDGGVERSASSRRGGLPSQLGELPRGSASRRAWPQPHARTRRGRGGCRRPWCQEDRGRDARGSADIREGEGRPESWC